MAATYGSGAYGSGPFGGLPAVVLAGATQPTGKLTNLVTQPKLAGASTNSGALLRSHGKVLSGAATNSGALVRKAAKALSGLNTPVGGLVQRVIFHVVGLATSVGVLSTFHGATRSLSGSATPTGALAKTVVRSVGGASTNTGLLTGAAAVTRGSFSIVANSFSGTQSRTLLLVGQNTSWATSTVWTTTFGGANLASDSIEVIGPTLAYWHITPGSGVGTITLSDGLHSAILTVLPVAAPFDELGACAPEALDELVACV